jgi:hypothetical protein
MQGISLQDPLSEREETFVTEISKVNLEISHFASATPTQTFYGNIYGFVFRKQTDGFVTRGNRADPLVVVPYIVARSDQYPIRFGGKEVYSSKCFKPGNIVNN